MSCRMKQHQKTCMMFLHSHHRASTQDAPQSILENETFHTSNIKNFNTLNKLFVKTPTIEKLNCPSNKPSTFKDVKQRCLRKHLSSNALLPHKETHIFNQINDDNVLQQTNNSICHKKKRIEQKTRFNLEDTLEKHSKHFENKIENTSFNINFGNSEIQNNRKKHKKHKNNKLLFFPNKKYDFFKSLDDKNECNLTKPSLVSSKTSDLKTESKVKSQNQETSRGIMTSQPYVSGTNLTSGLMSFAKQMIDPKTLAKAFNGE